jgi:hypothetical protein
MFDIAQFDLISLSQIPHAMDVPHPTVADVEVPVLDADGKPELDADGAAKVTTTKTYATYTDADGAVKNVKIFLYGPECEAIRKHRMVDAQRWLDAKREKDAKREPYEQTIVERHEENISLLVACTSGWEGFSNGGAAWDFTPENAFHLYEAFPRIRRAVDDFVTTADNFMTA